MAATSILFQGAAAGTSLAAPQAASGIGCSKVVPSFSGVRASPLVMKQLLPAGRAIHRPFAVFFSTAAEAAETTLMQCQAIVAEQLGIDVAKVQPDSKFSDLGADSLDTVEIVMALEEKFKISVEQEGAEKIVTVKDAADVIHRLVVEKADA